MVEYYIGTNKSKNDYNLKFTQPFKFDSLFNTRLFLKKASYFNTTDDQRAWDVETIVLVLRLLVSIGPVCVLHADVIQKRPNAASVLRCLCH